MSVKVVSISKLHERAVALVRLYELQGKRLDKMVHGPKFSHEEYLALVHECSATYSKIIELITAGLRAEE